MMDENERIKIIRSIFFPAALVAIIWLVKIAEILFDFSLVKLGLYPRTWQGLLGIITFPLIHSSEQGLYAHVFSNTFPLLALGTMIFYFYQSIAFQVFFWIYIMTGVWLWAAGREAYHIGASGLIYGFAFFLFFGGIFRKERTLMVLSLLVVFLYGSLIWGIFPASPLISWEAHLLGSLAGFITAFYFRKEGPQPKKFDWENEKDETENEDDYWKKGCKNIDD